MEAPESVVVLRFSALGDVILSSPAIEALKRAWPTTRIIYAVKERLAHIVRHDPHVDVVVPLRQGEGPMSYARRLRAEKPGAILDLHNKMRSKLIRALMPGIPTVVWHKRDLYETVTVKLTLQPYKAQMHFADRYHAAVEKLVGRQLERGSLRYTLGPGDREAAEGILRAAGVDLARPIFGISPGANWETKRWPAEHFAELARRALSAGFQVVVQGSAQEDDLGRAVCAAAPGAVNLCGQLDLPALGGFVSRCAAFAANDSGPMHLARGLGVPTLALFGSTDPGMFEFTGHAVLFKGVPCSPCSFFGRSRCPQGHFACMRELSAEAAWDALRPLLTAGPRPLNHA